MLMKLKRGGRRGKETLPVYLLIFQLYFFAATMFMVNKDYHRKGTEADVH